MKVIDVVGTIFAGIIGLAALSLVVAPDGNLAGVVTAIGNATANLIRSAKAYPQ